MDTPKSEAEDALGGAGAHLETVQAFLAELMREPHGVAFEQARDLWRMAESLRRQLAGLALAVEGLHPTA